MNEQDSDRIQVQEQEQINARNDHPTTSDIARAMNEPPPATHEEQVASHPVGLEEHKGEARPAPLLPNDQTENYRSRWMQIQTGFVDEPRQAVEQADSLVAEVMKRLAETFADEREKLEGQWGRGADVSTEDLRVALRRYRSFFDRLLSL